MINTALNSHIQIKHPGNGDKYPLSYHTQITVKKIKYFHLSILSDFIHFLIVTYIKHKKDL